MHHCFWRQNHSKSRSKREYHKKEKNENCKRQRRPIDLDNKNWIILLQSIALIFW